MDIIGFRLPTHTPGPQRHSSCGWVAIINKKEVGWINMSFLPNNVLKFEDAFVLPNYRGRGIYRKLWDTRWEYVNTHFKDSTAYAWCKPTSLPLLVEKGFIEGDTCVYVEKKIAE